MSLLAEWLAVLSNESALLTSSYLLLLRISCLTMTLLFCSSAISLAHYATAKGAQYAAASSGRLCGMPKAADRYHGVPITYTEQWICLSRLHVSRTTEMDRKDGFSFISTVGQFHISTASLFAAWFRLTVTFFWRTCNLSSSHLVQSCKWVFGALISVTWNGFEFLYPSSRCV